MIEMIDKGEFGGKYRATVLKNDDPEHRGRLRLEVADVFGKDGLSTWAECSVPFPGAPGVAAGFFVIPIVGAAVWVEFECGNQDYPVWSGGRWIKEQDLPAMALKPVPKKNGQNIVIQSAMKNTVVISDAKPDKDQGGIILKSSGNKCATIIVNETGIYINNGNGASIEMTGNTVSINGKALVIK